MGMLGQRPLQALSQPLPLSGPQFPTCKAAPRVRDQAERGWQASLSRTVREATQASGTSFNIPASLSHLQNGKGNPLPHRASRFK